MRTSRRTTWGAFRPFFSSASSGSGLTNMTTTSLAETAIGKFGSAFQLPPPITVFILLLARLAFYRAAKFICCMSSPPKCKFEGYETCFSQADNAQADNTHSLYAHLFYPDTIPIRDCLWIYTGIISTFSRCMMNSGFTLEGSMDKTSLQFYE